MDLKLSKTALREEKDRLHELTRFLPTLKLKKSLLQMEAELAEREFLECEKAYLKAKEKIGKTLSLFSLDIGCNAEDLLHVEEIKKGFQNIAGIEIPFLEEVKFKPGEYSLKETPPWLDRAAQELQELKKTHLKIAVAKERRSILLEEFRSISIRVNLFEKVLIPKSEDNIRKIKIYLGDVELAEVARAKLAKSLLEKKECGLI